MGFGEQTEDRDLPHYIVVGTEHPDGGTGYYAATRAGLKRVSRVFRDQQDAIDAAEEHSRFYENWLRGQAAIMRESEEAEVRIRDKGPEPTGLYGKPHPTQPGRSDIIGRGTTMEDLMYIDPVLNEDEDEEPAYRRVKTPVEDVDYFITGDRVVTDDGIRPAKASDYFTGVYGNVALGMEAPYPLKLSEDQTEKVASALLTFNLLGFRVRLERIHD